MRVGLFGGSFDPAHDGHVHVAETALKRLRLHRVVWLVSPQNPLKSGPAPLAERLAGARALAAGPSMIVSDFESRAGARYTLDTVRILKGRFPGVRFVWLMGSDNLAGFHRWRGWDQIARTLPLAVVARPGAINSSRVAPAARRFAHARVSSRAAAVLPAAPAPAWTYLRGPLNTTSSTALRAAKRSPRLPG
jgi:nicotinate-nucleotide adenylyltransferase